MSDKTLDLTVELAPRARFDLVDLRRHFAAEHAALSSYPRLPLLVLSHDRRLSRAAVWPSRLQRAAHSDLPRSVPDAVSRRRRLRARPARAPGGSRLGAARRRAAQRRLAPGVHGQRPAHLRHAPEPARTSRCSSSISTASTAASRGGAARASSASRRSAPVGTRAHRGAGVGAPDRLDQPEGSAPRRLRRSWRTS